MQSPASNKDVAKREFASTIAAISQSKPINRNSAPMQYLKSTVTGISGANSNRRSAGCHEDGEEALARLMLSNPVEIDTGYLEDNEDEEEEMQPPAHATESFITPAMLSIHRTAVPKAAPVEGLSEGQLKAALMYLIEVCLLSRFSFSVVKKCI